MREVLASVRSEAKTHGNPAALLSERVLPMRRRRSSDEHFGGHSRELSKQLRSL